MSKSKDRDYAQERKTAIARGETGVGSKSSDATRHRARRKMEKHLGRELKTSETVEHKKKLKDGGSNDVSNLSLMSLSKNTSEGGKSGNKAGKAAGGRKSKGSRSKSKEKGALHEDSK